MVSRHLSKKSAVIDQAGLRFFHADGICRRVFQIKSDDHPGGNRRGARNPPWASAPETIEIAGTHVVSHV